MSTWNGPYPKTCEYLESIGIDARLVCAEPIGPDGYFTVTLDENGKRVIDPLFNEAAKQFHPWPSAEVWRTVGFWLGEDRAKNGWVEPYGFPEASA